jgi:hypothetical protein
MKYNLVQYFAKFTLLSLSKVQFAKLATSHLVHFTTLLSALCPLLSYDILGAGMLWKPKEA